MLLMNECHTYFFKTNRRANILFLFYVCGPAAMCNVIRIGVYVQSGTPKVSYLAPPTASFSTFYLQPWKVAQLCITLLSHQTIKLLQKLLENKWYIVHIQHGFPKVSLFGSSYSTFFDSHAALLDSLVGHYIIVKWKF